MLKSSIIFFPLLLGAYCSFSQVALKDTFPPFALVELFTSEGCRSCPPADNLLKKIKLNAEKNHIPVYVAAYQVDYWNKSGWRDPFSKNQFTYLQQNYVSALNEKEMYTPHLVVNGKYSFVGSNEEKAANAISQALKQNAMGSLVLKKDSIVSDTLFVSYQSSISGNDFSLKVLLLESNLKSAVTTGENKGKTLHHENVCRVYYTRGLQSKTGQVKIPVRGLSLNPDFSLLGFAQQKVTLRVLSISTYIKL